MKQVKKIVCLLLIVCMVTTLLPINVAAATAAHGSCGGTLSWTLSSEGVLNITGSGNMTNFDYDDSCEEEANNPPWYEYRDNITKVVLPSGLTSIGNNAFSNCSIETVPSIPDGVKTIGEFAFACCYNMSGQLVLPSGLTNLGMYAFEQCENLTGSLTIPKGIRYIGYGAFWQCTGLTGSLTLPEGIVEIEGSAFAESGFSGKLTLPSSLRTIGERAFFACTNFTGSLIIPKGVVSIGQAAFCWCSGFSGKLTIPEGITTIEDHVFDECTDISEVVIPESVTSIGEYSFLWEANRTNLKSVYFSGNAPAVVPANATELDPVGNPMVIASFPSYATLYYIADKAGWSSPTWNGYKTATWSGINDVKSNGTDETVGKLYISSIDNNHTCFTKAPTFTLHFSKAVKAGKGAFHVYSAKKDNSVCYIDCGDGAISYSGNTVTVDLSSFSLPDGDFYFKIDSAAVVASDGTKYYGLTDKKVWTFAFEIPPAYNGITLKYAKSGHLFWKKDDITKPPYPDGTDEEYASALVTWAEKQGISNITLSKAKKMLDNPVYLPINTLKGSPLLLNEGGTTIRQTIEDIVFLEKLKPFVEQLDTKLGDIEMGSSFEPLHRETDIYEDVMDWYEQISDYLKIRNDKSNFFYSAGAPFAYETLLTAADAAGGKIFKYSKPIMTGMLNGVLAKKELNSLEAYSNYQDFKAGAKGIGTAYKAGKAMYKAVSEKSGGALVNLGSDMLQTYFKDSNNSVLREISNSWQQLDKATSAITVCMALGSSIGAFPLVMDLYNNMYEQVKNSVCACYFIGDYYVYDKYPTLYDAVYDDETCMPKFYAKDIMAGSASTDYGKTVCDAVLNDWCNYLGRITESAIREDCRQMRFDLVNYIMLLKYAKAYDAAQAKADIAKYVSAELSKSTTTMTVQCPVRVNVYDTKGGTLLASLSSEDNEIQTCEYGTLYILGENDETKCFVMNSEDYYVEIVPYDSGTMDVLIVNEDGEGATQSKYFEDVVLDTNAAFSLNASSSDTMTKSDKSNNITISQTEEIPVDSIVLPDSLEIAVGETKGIHAEVLPNIATNKSLSWESSAPDVVSVDSQSGELNALSAGEAIITATSSNGKSTSCTISAYIPAESVSVPLDAMSMYIGEEFSIEAAVLPENASHCAELKSSNLRVVAAADGKLIAKGQGDAVITASIDGKETSF